MARKKTPLTATSRSPMDDDPVVRGLLRAISLKRIKPGTKLVADQLVEAFGSNRTHIRQVFEYLGSRNIIQLYPNRGAYLAQPSVDEARQIFATRRVLERQAVLQLIDNLNANSIDALKRHVGREHSHGEHDRWSTLTITGEFHGLIANLCGNSVLARFIDELVLRSSLIIATFEQHGGEDDCSPEAHPDIAQRILARDRKGAAAAMETHLQAMEDRLSLDAEPEPQLDLVSIFADLGVKPGRRRKAAG